MKKILTIVTLLLTTITANAQFTFTTNTYYLIPPTSGCNGVWAVFNDPGCLLYSTAPGQCAQFDHVVGDTLFLKLCSFPCQFVASSQGSGDVCFQTTCSSTTGIAEYYNTKELDITWQDLYTFTLQNRQGAFDRVEIISITGQVIIEKTSLNEDITINTSNLANGLYVIKAFKNGGIVNTKKIIKD